MGMIKVDYPGHNGFLVETETHLLLFDYFRGDLSVLDDKPADKPLYVFASHAHGDHFNPDIFKLRGGRRDVHYLLSFDIEGRTEACDDISYLEADRTYDIPGLGTVETFLSTDEGVAFLVSTEDAVIYHAGDLHWWDWEGEDPGWLAEQERVFKQETGKLAGKQIDIAFAVLDDRLEDNYAEGLNRFLAVCRPRYVFPMHFWEDRSVVARFKEQMDPDILTQIMNTADEDHWEINL